MDSTSKIHTNGEGTDTRNLAAKPSNKGLFHLGTIYATTVSLEVVTPPDILLALKRHLTGDWGNVCKEDGQANDDALKTGERILSVYKTASGQPFWIITEADRSVTTILLPSDY